ncbi:RNA-binding S4 domain-containing protein [Demequina flava]|uniref:RNA-binding S4 domain-containing protein n=1 Tax=Demequina flava TaxID=1095025 RepID=UPI0007860D9A|nr:RNA-binding S4 domain-containing protein [Demequina flava]
MAPTDPIQDAPIGDDGIRLGQFLQLAGLVDSGGEAKEAIREGDVRVNGEVDLRRGRQLQVGDVVTCGDRQVRVSR